MSNVEVEVLTQPVMAQRIWQWRPGDGLWGMREKWDSGFMEAECKFKRHKAPHWNPEGFVNDPTLMLQMQLMGQILGSKSDAKPPKPPCLCGINAWKLTHLFSEAEMVWPVSSGPFADPFFFLLSQIPVLGIVELGGEVHEYDFGYRAQYGSLVEATVLTPLPIDPQSLTQLEDQYQASFRVMPYPEWRQEWEATYGRDRETKEKDQDPSAATAGITIPGGTSVSIPPGAFITHNTIQGVSFSGQGITLAGARAGASQVRVRNRWQEWMWRNTLTYGDLAMGVAVVVALLMLLSMATDALGWTTTLELSGYEWEPTYDLTNPFD